MAVAVSSDLLSRREDGVIDLDREAIYRDLETLEKRPALFNFLTHLDRVDQWAVDHEASEVDETALLAYLDGLKELFSSYYPVLHEFPKEMTDILSHLTTTRCIYLLRYLSFISPEFLPIFLKEVVRHIDEPESGAIFKRISVLDRAALLSEIFSSERIRTIHRILGGDFRD